MVINWDEYFLSIAKLSAMRSKDPHTQVGACIVNSKKKIVGTGFNGFVATSKVNNDKFFTWSSTGDNRSDTKYAYVVHAELNAILNSTVSLDGSTIYCTLFPCCECAKAIIQSGIKEVVYSNNYKDEDSNIATLKMFEAAGITARKINDINISIDKMEN